MGTNKNSARTLPISQLIFRIQENISFDLHKLDRYFAALIFFQVFIAIAILSFNPFIPKYTLLTGAGIVFPAIYLAVFYPGKPITRHVIAITQTIIASLMFYQLNQYIVINLHLLISLAVLTIYKDWRIFISTIIIIAFEIAVHSLPQYFPFQNTTPEFSINHWLMAFNATLIFGFWRYEKKQRLKIELPEKLKESEERFHKFVNTVEDLIYKTDKRGFFTFVNPAFIDLMGYNLEDNKKLRYVDVIAQQYKKQVARFYTWQIKNKEFSTYNEFPVITADGKEVWIGQKVQLVYENDKITGFQALARDIHEIKSVQNALAASEEQYRLLANLIPQQVWRVGINCEFHYFNETTAQYFNFDSLEDSQKINWLDLIHPDDVEKNKQLWINSIKKIEPYESEYRQKRYDGEYRWFLGQAIPITNEKNRVVEFFGTSTDIHDRKLAQEEADKNKEYRNLFKLANDAIIIYDPNSGEILNVNDYACAVLGYTREEFIGSDISLVCFDSSGRVDRQESFLQGKPLEPYQSIVKSKSGSIIHLSVNPSLIEFQGKPAILAINRDITAALESEKALRKNENKLRSLIENMQEGLVEVDLEEKILFANQRFCEMVGYSYDELIGQNVLDMLADDEGRARVAEAHKQRYQGISNIYEMKLISKSGEPLWFLIGGVPITDEDGKITGSMGVHTNITELKRKEEQLRFNGLHDALTGLPNRHLLIEHLQNAINRVARYRLDSFAVLFLDLNLFKIINDSLGHIEGDNLLIMISKRLKECLRINDIVARFGGDEFTILLDRITGMNDVLQIVDRIKETLKKPFNLSGRDIFISTSIGIVLSDPKYTKPEEILRDADIAMYRSKINGKSDYEIFDQRMHDQANMRLQLETELRSAIKKDELTVHYQPIIELASNRIVGFEALIRWIHPTRGLVSPFNFIPIAEESGLIIPIGEWILRESCRQTRQWQLQNPLHKNLSVSVNLSCKQFQQSDLLEKVEEILKETDLQAECLRLEITESHLMQKYDNAFETVNQLRNLGVKISIDDFGTGYSNLSYLHQMPVNYLKIDRSFINRMEENNENYEIVRTILALAKNLGFAVIAEGIETATQAQQLKMFNCKYGQGYFFSKPVTSEDAGKLIYQSNTINPLISVS